MSSNNLGNNGLDANALTLIQQDLMVRKQEIELKGLESQNNLEIKKLEIEKNSIAAEKSIQANYEIEKGRKEAYEKTITLRHSTIKWSIAAFTIIAGISIYLGKQDIVMEIIKTIAAIGGAGFGAYQLGKNKNNHE